MASAAVVVVAAVTAGGRSAAAFGDHHPSHLGGTAGAFQAGSCTVLSVWIAGGGLGTAVVPAVEPTEVPVEEPIEGPVEEPVEEPVVVPVGSFHTDTGCAFRGAHRPMGSYPKGS